MEKMNIHDLWWRSSLLEIETQFEDRDLVDNSKHRRTHEVAAAASNCACAENGKKWLGQILGSLGSSAGPFFGSV